MATAILINDVALDYATFTTFFYDAYERLVQALVDSVTDASRTQAFQEGYKGSSIKDDYGTGFHGTGTQKGVPHFLVEAKGALAQKFTECVIGAQIANIRCTRLDVQKTVIMPEDYRKAKGQLRLFNRMEDKPGLATSWAQSHDQKFGKLATVYIGSREHGSLMFTRVYEKVHANKLYLRFETVFKKERADSLFQRMIEQWDFLENSHMGALTRLKDEVMEGIFATEYRPDLPRVSKGTSNTEAWLLGLVLDVFGRVISAHEEHEVSDAFRQKLIAAGKWELPT